MARTEWKMPTADDVAKWSTSKLLACYVQVALDARSSGKLRALYAAEIDRRIPPSGGR
jgi:hypothetical protein